MTFTPQLNREATRLFVWLFERALRQPKNREKDTSFNDLKASLGSNGYLQKSTAEAGVEIDGDYWLLDPLNLSFSDREGELIIEADLFRETFGRVLSAMPFLNDMPELNRYSLMGEFDLIEPIAGDKYYSPRDSFFMVDPPTPENAALAVISFEAYSEDSTDTRTDVELYNLKIALFDNATSKQQHIQALRESHAQSALRVAGKGLNNINALADRGEANSIITLAGLAEMEKASEGGLSQLLEAFIYSDNIILLNESNHFKSVSWVANSINDMAVNILLTSGDCVILDRQAGQLTFVGEGINDSLSDSFLHQLNLFIMKEVGINLRSHGTYEFDTPKSTLTNTY